MIYKPSDIEVYIMSHNRPQGTINALIGFFNQTVEGFSLTVIDNSDDESVKNAVSQINTGHFNYYRNPNLNEINLLQIQRICSKSWVVAFHDDDTIHPQYIEHILEIVNKCENVKEIVTLTKLCESPQNDWVLLNHCEYSIIKHPAYLADMFFKGAHIPFCSVVYYSEYFKSTVFDTKQYGKVADRPFVLDCSKYENIAFLKNIYVQTGTGMNDRDSGKNGSKLSIIEHLSLNKKYRDLIVSKSDIKKNFLLLGTTRVLMPAFAIDSISKRKLLKLAIEYGAITKTEFVLGIPYYLLYNSIGLILKLIIA